MQRRVTSGMIIWWAVRAYYRMILSTLDTMGGRSLAVDYADNNNFQWLNLVTDTTEQQ